MYAAQPLAGSLSGIESLNVSMYWNAIKNKIQELRELPTWTTNHAMKLGIAVTNLRARGRHKDVEILETEIRKVNDDIAKAWKVRQYIDKYLPEWMAAINQPTAPVVVTGSAAPSVPVVQSSASVPNAKPLPFQTPATTEPSVTGWIKSWFGGGGVQGLGVLPIVLGATAIAALAYVVTTGMAIYQDYVTKKDLTTAVIEGKMTSGQASDILVAARPSESIFGGITKGIGTNIGTIAILGLVGYLAVMYMGSRKAVA